MLSALRLYAHTFEPKFLAATESFYAAESRKQIASELSIGEYIHFIQQRLSQEDERALAYLDEATRAPLTHTMEQTLIAAHSAHMLGPAFSQLLDCKRSAELAIMYKLFARIRQLDQMRTAFETYVKQRAGAIVQSGCVTTEEAKEAEAKAAEASASSSSSIAAPAAPVSTPATMVVDLLRLKATLDEVLIFAFDNDSDFLKSLKVAFEHALNLIDHTPAELIAKFIDRVLRTGGRGIKITPYATATTGNMDDVVAAPPSSSLSLSASALPAASSASASASATGAGVGGEEVEPLLDSVMFLFRYIHGKDVFQAFYKQSVAKRLLLSKSASLDSEKSMITKIKQECGASFTTKLEGMFKDMELSKDIQREYETHVAAQRALKAGAAAAATSDTTMTDASSSSSSGGGNSGAADELDLSVQVLTTGSWPAYTPVDCKLPAEVARAHEDFKLFYLNKHSGRKLIWHHSLGTAILRAHFPRTRKELAVSAVQAVVLMLFNEHVKLTLDQIAAYSGITDIMEVKRTLASLTFTDDLRILIKVS